MNKRSVKHNNTIISGENTCKFNKQIIMRNIIPLILDL